MNHPQKNTYDLVICGGGLAGQTLARQVKLAFPDMRLLVLEQHHFPLPVSTAKVGESTVEISSFYLGNVLQLKDYFKNNHFKKLGFRFFTGRSRGRLADRPEIGLSHFPLFDSFQMDRGVLENDLYRINKAAGIEVHDGVKVMDIIIDPKASHTVVYKASGETKAVEVKTRWVIDAMGRKRFLQRKLGLGVPSDEKFSSAWFRVKGRIDVEDFVDDTEEAWHARVPFRVRYYSTNHLLGKGYWVWLIPLASGNTSIGIVASEQFHSFKSFSTFKRAENWLETHEPVVAAGIRGKEILDFVRLRNYSYSSRKIFSEDRWACIGEAAVFPDPYYSPGSNLIGFENLITTKLIGQDRDGAIDGEEVDRFNHFVLSLNENYSQTIHSSYAYFDQEFVLSLSYLWDLVIGWASLLPQMFNFIFLDKEKNQAIRAISGRLLPVITRMEQLFKDWANQGSDRFTFGYIDYLAIPFIKHIYDRNIHPGKSLPTLRADHEENVKDIETFAQVIFLMMVEDVFPEKLPLFAESIWLNAEAISLDVNRWESDGLFTPVSSPGDLKSMRSQIRSLYSLREKHAEAETPASDHHFDFSFR